MVFRITTGLLVPVLATACAPTGQHGRNANDDRLKSITLRVSGFGTYADAGKDRAGWTNR